MLCVEHKVFISETIFKQLTKIVSGLYQYTCSFMKCKNTSPPPTHTHIYDHQRQRDKDKPESGNGYMGGG